MILLIFSNIIVALSAMFLVENFFTTKTRVDKILLCFLLFFAQVIIVELIFGMLGRFYFREIFLSHCVILLLIILSVPEKNIFIFKKIKIDFILNNRLLLLAGSVFFCFFVVKFFIALINPPVYADSLQYHLVFPAYWIKNGNLINPFYLFGGIKGYPEMSCPTYQPINAQLFFAWLMLPLKNAFLANMGESPFYLIGILAVYSILRKFSIDKNTALFSGLLWVLIPNLFKQLKTASQIDLICAVLFLLTFNSLLFFKKEVNIKNALILGISLGILIGTKLFNIVWASALLPVSLYYLFLASKEVSLKRMLAIILIIIFSVLIWGGYMYFKNFFYSGNPFFPFRVNLFGNLLPGLMDSATFNNIYVPRYANGIYDILFCEGLGVQFIVFILPGTLFFLASYFLIKKNIKPIGEYLLILTTPLIMVLFFYFFIRSGNTRYFFPYLGIGLIAAIIFLNKFSWGKKYITIFGFISIIASAFELAHGRELAVSLILSITLFTFLLMNKNIIINFYNRTNGNKALVLIPIILTTVFYFLNEKYNKEEFLRYPSILSKKESWQRDIAFGWRWLNENTEEGKRVAYVGRTEIYPLFGTKLKNDVLYVPVNKIPMIPYNLAVGFYRKEKNFKDWIDNLEKLKINFLFISLPQDINCESDNPKDFPIEDQWALRHPESFNPVFKNSLVHIYKVVH